MRIGVRVSLLVACCCVIVADLSLADSALDVKRAKKILELNCPACDKRDIHKAVTGIVINGKDYWNNLALACGGAQNLSPKTKFATVQQDKFLEYCYGRTKKP